MELYKKLLAYEITKAAMQILESTPSHFKDALEVKAVQALQKIKTIIENDSLSDFECVESIVSVFEEIGSNCGNRHDF